MILFTVACVRNANGDSLGVFSFSVKKFFTLVEFRGAVTVFAGDRHAKESKRHKEKELKLAELHKIDENYGKMIKEVVDTKKMVLVNYSHHVFQKESSVAITDRELGILRLENLKVRQELDLLRDEVNELHIFFFPNRKF